MHIYLSFDSADLAQAQAFAQKLQGHDPDLVFIYPPFSHSKDLVPTAEAKAKIVSAIKGATVAIGIVSEVTKDNDWCNFEMSSAEIEGRGIVGFFIEGGEVSPMDWPDFFRQRYNRYDLWDQVPLPKMIKAIKRAERKGTQVNVFGE